VLRFVPPLTISDADLTEGLRRLHAALTDYMAAWTLLQEARP